MRFIINFSRINKYANFRRGIARRIRLPSPSLHLKRSAAQKNPAPFGAGYRNRIRKIGYCIKYAATCLTLFGSSNVLRIPNSSMTLVMGMLCSNA